MPGTGGGAGRARLSATVASAARSSVAGVGRRLGGQRLRALAVEPARVEPHRAERRARRRRAQEGEVGRDALDLRRVQRRRQPLQRRRPVGAVGDDLGDHRVVVRRHRVALLDAGVDAHAVHAARAGASVRSRPIEGRKPARRVLGVEPRLEGVAAAGDLLLAQRQRLAGGDAQLPLDQVQPGDRLGHRVLDLQPRVHLDEVEAARLVEQELDRAGVLVAGGQRGAGGGPARAPRAAPASSPGAGASSMIFWCRRCSVQSRSNRCTALPCRSANTCTSTWRGRVDQPLEQHPVVAERGLGLAPAGGQRVEEVGRLRRPGASPCRRRRPRP